MRLIRSSLQRLWGRSCRNVGRTPGRPHGGIGRTAVGFPSYLSTRQRGGGLPGKPERLRNRPQREGPGEAMRGGIHGEGPHPGVRELPGAVRGPFNRSGRAPILVFRLAPASFLAAPVSGPLAMVEASPHHDFVLLDDEEERVGASFRGEAQSHSISLREALGEATPRKWPLPGWPGERRCDDQAPPAEPR